MRFKSADFTSRVCHCLGRKLSATQEIITTLISLILGLESNTVQGTGAPRNGPSLLSGLLICGRCGMRMATQYSNNGNGLRYQCSRLMTDYGEPLCQSLAGKPLDELTTKLVLQSLEPAALEISLKVAQDLDAERCQMRSHWEKNWNERVIQ